MPRKPGIFAQHKKEILKLKSKGVGDTEIAAHLSEKYSIRVTKQNLAQSYEKYLKNRSSKTRKKAAKKRSQKASNPPAETAPNFAKKTHPPEALESPFDPPEKVAETLAFREQLTRIQIELETLLDAEVADGRFSPWEVEQLRAWADTLFALHPETARDVFKEVFGSTFAAYRNAYERALKTIAEDGLANEFESRARLADEETSLIFLEMEKERLARQEKERRMAELARAKNRNPEAFKALELTDVDLSDVVDPPQVLEE